MTIQPIEKGNFVQFTNDKDNNYTLKINIGKIVNVSYVHNDFNVGDEIKLELTYSFVMDVSLINSVEKKQTLILKIRGVEKDKIVNLLINVRNVETKRCYLLKV